MEKNNSFAYNFSFSLEEPKKDGEILKDYKLHLVHAPSINEMRCLIFPTHDSPEPLLEYDEGNGIFSINSKKTFGYFFNDTDLWQIIGFLQPISSPIQVDIKRVGRFTWGAKFSLEFF